MSQDHRHIVSPNAPAVQRNWWAYVLILFVCVVNFLPYLYVVLTGFMDAATSNKPEPQWIFTPTSRPSGSCCSRRTCCTT